MSDCGYAVGCAFRWPFRWKGGYELDVDVRSRHDYAERDDHKTYTVLVPDKSCYGQD